MPYSNNIWVGVKDNPVTTNEYCLDENVGIFAPGDPRLLVTQDNVFIVTQDEFFMTTQG